MACLTVSSIFLMTLFSTCASVGEEMIAPPLPTPKPVMTPQSNEPNELSKEQVSIHEDVDWGQSFVVRNIHSGKRPHLILNPDGSITVPRNQILILK